jgi:predicted nucleotidyltransferase component of viral defense system
MILAQELRKAARDRSLPVDLVEKDYILGWLLFGIASSSVSKQLAFKGGTALSKVYFPNQWRLSEDLDFTLLKETDLTVIATSIEQEIPRLVQKASGIAATIKHQPFTNPTYLQSRFQYTGPISKNKVKIEISKEEFVGDVVQKSVPQLLDYPRFVVNVYSLENLLAEKIRTLLQRGKVRDYYDVWKLLKVEKFDNGRVKDIFLQKCKTKNIVFSSLEQFFPTDLIGILKPYLNKGLTRLTAEPLPPLETMIEELKTSLGQILT